MTLDDSEGVIIQQDLIINEAGGPKYVPGVRSQELDQHHLFREYNYKVIEELIQLYNYIGLIIQERGISPSLNKYLWSITSHKKSRGVTETLITLKASSVQEIAQITNTSKQTVTFTLNRLISLQLIRKIPILNNLLAGRKPSIYCINEATLPEIQDAENRLLEITKENITPKVSDADRIELERGKNIIRSWLENPAHKSVTSRRIPTQLLRNNTIPYRLYNKIFYEVNKEGHKL